jgi:methionine synthase II (cobalamin-independent)
MGEEQKNDANTALSMARELVNKGRTQDACYYFMNALTASPGDITAIIEYVDAASSLLNQRKEAGELEAASESIDWLVSFLRERILHVCPEDIQEILDMIASLESENSSIEESSIVHDNVPEEVTNLLYEFTSKDGLNGTVPDMACNVESRLQAVEFCLESPDVLQDKQAEQLEQLRMKLAQSIEFDTQAAQALALLEHAESDSSPDTALYCLQIAEGAVRQMAAFKKNMNEKRAKLLDSLVIELRNRSDQYGKTKIHQESKEVWDVFKKKHSADITERTKWEEPNSFIQDSDCETELHRIQSLMKELQKIARRISGDEYVEKINSLSAKLQSLHQSVSITQQKRYNQWAMNQIQQAYKDGSDSLGVIKNVETLGKTIYNYLGNIDVRILTSDVNRCYSEVFEHLFKHLKGPKSKDDFETEGRKLKVLNDISKCDNVMLQKF